MPALLALFFLSGATSLVYQTVWARELHLVLGTSSFAISTVLSAFMGGLGIGGALAARSADRVARPLQVYGLLEAGIGVYALGFPWLVAGLAEPAYLAIHRAFEPGPVLFGAIQAALVGVLLLPPTAAMGATLPLLARIATDGLARVGDRIGLLYGVNTAGAVAGTGLAGLALLPLVGLGWTTWITAAGNLLLGAAALALDRRLAPPRVADDLDRDLVGGAIRPERAALWVIGLGGAASLACEVAWARLVGLVLGGTTYAFTAMLLAVLLGIAIGGRLGGPLADVALRRGGTAGVLGALAAVELAIAATTWGLTFLWPEVPYWFVWLFDALDGGVWAGAPFSAALLLCVLVLLPPAALMGAAFPLAVRAAAGDAAALGRPVGLVYAVNTLGGVVGSAAAGFVLMPLFTLRGAVGAAAGVNLLAASLATLRAGRPRLAAGLAAASVLPFALRAPWDPIWMSGGLYQYVSEFEDHSREGIRRFATNNQELLFYAEGLSTVVTVARNTNTGNIWLANNGKVDASSNGDMPTQVLCSLVAAQHAPALDDVLVIGLASGITAGATSLLPDLGQLEVVELEPAIFEAARFFEETNHGVLDDRRVQLIANDGRNHVLRAGPATWDLVVSEPPNPYLSGVANLFTREFWATGRARLKPGGVWSQWVQVYGMGEDDLRALLRTFARSYPHVALYAVLDQADLVLVASEAPIRPTLERAERLLADPTVAAELAAVGVDDPIDLVAMYAMDREAILRFTGDGPEVTDDNMRIEYSAPLNLHRDTQASNWALVLSAAEVPWDVLPDDSAVWSALAAAYADAGDERRAEQVLERLETQLTAR